MSGPAQGADWRFLSALPGLAWPALPAGAGQAVLAILQQLQATQWLPAERLRALQETQLALLLAHARASAPYYRERIPGRPGEGLETVPVLTRRALQENFEALQSARPPPEHGPTLESRTSGATGAPVRVVRTALTQLLWRALTLRDHLWHRRDLAGKLAVIRQGIKPGTARSWGPATEDVVETGPCAMLTPASSIAEQLDWLERERPEYLLTYPSSLAELARLSLQRGARLRGLREARAIGEALAPETRQLCRDAWGVPVSDFYSAQEAGYIALQCPRHEHYHVQSESVRVEILDDADRPCAPGQVGRVVVTDLHNFAMPLIRYELGDYAEAGEPCGCGRGLPVLRRILGRVRNTLVTADGTRYWPSFGVRGVLEIAPVQQAQFVQKSFDLIEARIVVSAPLTQEQEKRLGERFLSRLPPGFRIEFVYRDAIPRSAGGKFEDFYSEVSAGSR